MSKEIEQIVKTLEFLIQDKEAQMFVAVQTGFDESGLVGTKDAYLRVAKLLLEFIIDAESGKLQEWHLLGYSCPGSSNISAAFDSLCEIVIDTTSLTQTTSQAKKIMEVFRDQ